MGLINATVTQTVTTKLHSFNIYMDFLARQVIQECEEAGVRGFKVAYRINGELVEAWRQPS